MQYTTGSENYLTSVKDSPSKWRGKDDKGYVYKKSSYQYSGSGHNSASYTNKSLIDQNVDQLDELLEDLKNERQITRERDLSTSTSNYRTIEQERADPAVSITKTTNVVKTSRNGENPRGFEDIENFSTSDYSTIKSNDYSSLQGTLNLHDHQVQEKIYGTNKGTSKSKNYDSNRTFRNNEPILSSTSTTTATHLENNLQSIALSDNILPVPGTKVTTTVRTYTYEIPAGAPNNLVSNDRSHFQNSVNYNTLQRTETNNVTESMLPQPLPTIPQNVIYNTESYSTTNKNNERPIVSNQTYEIREHREANQTILNNTTPQQQPRSPAFHPPSSTNKTVYNIHSTTENIQIVPEHDNYPPSRNIPVQNTSLGGLHSLLLEPTTNRYYYKESSNVVNTIHAPPTVLTDGPSLTQKPLPIGAPYGGEGYPPADPSTVTYKYSSSTTNSRRGPDYSTLSPTMPPAPFPVDGVEYSVANGGPPKRVDDLMQSFGNADAVDRADVGTPHRKREIETAVASPNQQNIPTVNKPGKEVYYPPGHEMMIKREEMSAGSAAGGRWAKGSGMYEYESGYKSKTKTKSGGAMVPVCLPLCCAMPCSIM